MTPTYPGRDAFTEPRARSTDPETSHEAARKVDAAGQRGRIMELLRAPLMALTADEVDDILGRADGRWLRTTAGRRLSELKRRGLVEACGERRTRSNRMATVYRAVS